MPVVVGVDVFPVFCILVRVAVGVRAGFTTVVLVVVGMAGFISFGHEDDHGLSGPHINARPHVFGNALDDQLLLFVKFVMGVDMVVHGRGAYLPTLA